MAMKIPFFQHKQLKESFADPEENIPAHIAIIMDGNGRWAGERGMPRAAGHKEGLSALVKIVKAAAECKVKVLTLYAFSTENWKRPTAEIEFILKLPQTFLNIYLPDLIRNNVRVTAIGDVESLPAYTQKALQQAIDRTKHNDGLQLTIALNYGSRGEILHAVKEILADLDAANMSLEELNEQSFSKYLYTAGTTAPDLLIRTGGEKRLSNFLLWQLAYTEFWFTDVLWPDFSEKEFMEAVGEYQQRKRRYGGI
ncbi:isoprenyl transferase [Alkalicoccus daliensis]|uniref:Isoprenyl transferase n=1 Tax=Alkalicoccus daliensis TaxID=745820 RepID=A0A1H0F6B2_9BACI|nr:isoprenyl transferase [Alkalicoccus daliensis]SDN90111.1 Undecaprenyl pyrophosphate synthetase [Alkalicoccus daliensis]